MARDETVDADGEMVRYLRKQVKGWSQERLETECKRISDASPKEDQLSCARGSIQNIENGKQPFPSTLRCVALALGVSYEALLKQRGGMSKPLDALAGPTAARDYYSEIYDAALRSVVRGKHDIMVRRQTIVAIKDGLRSLRVNFGPVWGSDLSASLIEHSPHRLLELPTASPDLDRKLFDLEFDKPLPAGAKTAFALKVEAKVRGGALIPPHHAVRVPTRIERFVIRATFASDPPKTMIYRVHKPDSSLVLEEDVPVDAITFEARKEVVDPIIGYHFSLNWDEAAKPLT